MLLCDANQWIYNLFSLLGRVVLIEKTFQDWWLHPLSCSSPNTISTITTALTSSVFRGCWFLQPMPEIKALGISAVWTTSPQALSASHEIPSQPCWCISTWLVQCLKGNCICYWVKSLQSSSTLQYSFHSRDGKYYQDLIAGSTNFQDFLFAAQIPSFAVSELWSCTSEDELLTTMTVLSQMSAMMPFELNKSYILKRFFRCQYI